MKKFKVSEEYKEPVFEDNSLVYDSYYGMYFLRSSDKSVDMAVVKEDDYYRHVAGEVNHIFPQYDIKKHYVDRHENPTWTQYEKCILTLKEYQDYDIKSFPYGIFGFHNTNQGTGLKQISFAESDTYVDIGKKLKLYENFCKFKNNEDKYKKLGQKQREATLLYGPPGNGKTLEITRLAKIAKEEKFRVFFINDGNIKLSELNNFRPLLEKDWSIFVIEELTERTHGNAVEELLSFLDGETSWNKSFTIATTNHPEEIPWNIIDRPSRFKHVVEVKNPNESEREAYFRAMGIKEEDILKAVEVTNNLSLDYIKNITFDGIVSDRPIPEIVLEYKQTKLLISKQFKNTKLGL